MPHNYFYPEILCAAARLKAAARNNDGMAAVIFALAFLPAMLFMGGGIDFMRVSRARAELQQALDVATLAAAADSKSAQSYLKTNDANGALLSKVSASWVTNPDGSVSGTATGQMTTAFLRLAHVDSITVTAASTATRVTAHTPSTAIFTLTGAYGWYWKEVDLYTHTVGASNDTLIASYFYQPVDLGGQNGRGTGITTAAFLQGGAMVSGPIDTQISLGQNYDNAYLTMTVYSDGCGPEMAPSTLQSGSTTKYACVASGTKSGRKTYTKATTPVIYSTANAAQSRNLFVNGVNMYSPQKPPSISQILPCPANGVASITNTHAWEDTPYAGSLNTAGLFSSQ